MGLLDNNKIKRLRINVTDADSGELIDEFVTDKGVVACVEHPEDKENPQFRIIHIGKETDLFAILQQTLNLTIAPFIEVMAQKVVTEAQDINKILNTKKENKLPN